MFCLKSNTTIKTEKCTKIDQTGNVKQYNGNFSVKAEIKYILVYNIL